MWSNLTANTHLKGPKFWFKNKVQKMAKISSTQVNLHYVCHTGSLMGQHIQDVYGATFLALVYGNFYINQASFHHK